MLAYSTVSQLAYMLAALAVGSALAAIFHLLTHAAFKALLFLAAGSVIHAVGTNLMPDMGGLRRLMPVTFVTMTVGLAALAGLPPFAGFFSKEAVLGAAEETAAHHDGPAAAWTGWLVLVVGLRDGRRHRGLRHPAVADDVLRRSRAAAVAAHESSAAMRWPLVVLAVPAALLGLVGLPAGLAAGVAGAGAGHALGAGRGPGRAAPRARHVGALRRARRSAGAAVVWLRLAARPGCRPVAGAGPAPPGPGARLLRRRPLRPGVVRPVPAGHRASVRRTDDERRARRACSAPDAARAALSGADRADPGRQRQTYLTGLLAGVLLIVAGVVVLT